MQSRPLSCVSARPSLTSFCHPNLHLRDRREKRKTRKEKREKPTVLWLPSPPIQNSNPQLPTRNPQPSIRNLQSATCNLQPGPFICRLFHRCIHSTQSLNPLFKNKIKHNIRLEIFSLELVVVIVRRKR